MKKSNNKFTQMQKKIEEDVVSGYKMIENKFVDTFLSEDSDDEQPNTNEKKSEVG